VVQRDFDTTVYTRDGSFRLSPLDGDLMLVTSEGFPILDVAGEPIIIPGEVNVSTMSVRDDGVMVFSGLDGEIEDFGIQLALVQFPNVQGLEAIGRNFFIQTGASGEPLMEADGETVVSSSILQGFLESSNVNLAEEMVRLIIAQRAYEVNSRAIQASDDMLQQANQLRR